MFITGVYLPTSSPRGKGRAQRWDVNATEGMAGSKLLPIRHQSICRSSPEIQSSQSASDYVVWFPQLFLPFSTAWPLDGSFFDLRLFFWTGPSSLLPFAKPRRTLCSSRGSLTALRPWVRVPINPFPMGLSSYPARHEPPAAPANDCPFTVSHFASLSSAATGLWRLA